MAGGIPPLFKHNIKRNFSTNKNVAICIFLQIADKILQYNKIHFLVLHLNSQEW